MVWQVCLFLLDMDFIKSKYLVTILHTTFTRYTLILFGIRTLRLLLMREMMLRHMDSRTNMQLKFSTIAAPRAKGNPP